MTISVFKGPLVLRPARTFVDGQYFDHVDALDIDEKKVPLSGIFCTSALLREFESPDVESIYVWRRHVFAVETPRGQTEDIDGVKNSFLYRDKWFVLFACATIVLLPYVIWVAVKKVEGRMSFWEMDNALRHA